MERKKKIALSIGVIAIITAIITAITMLVSTNNQKAKLAADPEIQRSMEYEQV